jgi:tetratricopeptide (TPR) repeat protein
VAFGPDPAFLLARAHVRRATTDTTGALRDYQAVLDARPEALPALLGRIALGLQLKKWPDVAEDLSLARALDATHPEVNQLFEHTLHLLVAEGLEHERARRFDEAEARYTQALAIAPANAAARIRRDRLEHLRTRLREAEASPLDLEAQERLATVYVQDGRFEDVLTLWHSFLSRKPRNGKALLARGQAYFTLGKTDEAVADAKAACALGLGEACEEANRFGTAGE